MALDRERERTIVLREDYFISHFRTVLRDLENLVSFRGYERVNIDFSRVRTCFPDQIMPIIASCIKYRSEGVRFNVIPPAIDSLARTFHSSNWLHLIDPNSYDQSNDDRPGCIPARSFSTEEQQYVVVNNILDSVLMSVDYLTRDHLRALEWSLNELMDNVLTHSSSESGGVVQLTNKWRSKEIEFVVADAGIGIPNSLRAGLNALWSDSQAIEESVKEGVTRGTGQGNGLYGSLQIASVSGGGFSINSGRAYFSLSRDGRTQIHERDENFSGTSVDCSFSYSRPLVLESALKFQGKSYGGFDLIDSRYDADDGGLMFSLEREAESFGNRSSGNRLRRKFENIFAMMHEPRAIIDCKGNVMSSSFADEFFAKIIPHIGVNVVREKVRFMNLSGINYSIIDRSVRQRLGIGFIDVFGPSTDLRLDQ